jgi:LacI family transcriptional regulator
MKRAIIILDPDVRINQQIVLGFCEELQREEDWDIHVLPRDDMAIERLETRIRAIAPSVIAVRAPSRKCWQSLLSTGLPVAIVADAELEAFEGTAVLPDRAAIGEMAANYLLGQGFANIACVGFERPIPSVRETAFCSTVEACGVQVHRFHLQGTVHSDHPFGEYGNPEALDEWLCELPKPCAIFAHSDQPGAYTVRACARSGIRVPEEVSVLGVDDDPLYCNTVTPNLASIHVPNARIGVEAARLLLDWKPGRRVVNVPPTTVIERPSCRFAQRGDPLVDKALKYLRTEVARGVKVRDLQALTGLSPHQLVYRFNLVTGHTPMDMILRHRISVAKQLLAETSLPIATVGTKAGFNSAAQFFVAFRKLTGQSPSTYREQFTQA